jgi:hypothetical protein
MNPEHFTLARTQWQFFATLTFKDEKVAERRGVRLVFALLRRTSGWFRVYFPRLKWAARLEAGELRGRLHFHVLVAGLPENGVHSRTCQAIKALWEKRWKVGIADVRVWESGRDAVSYITKGASDFSLVGANQYEADKFGGRCAVMCSESLLKTVGAAIPGADRASRTEPQGLNSGGKDRVRVGRLCDQVGGKPLSSGANSAVVRVRSEVLQQTPQHVSEAGITPRSSGPQCGGDANLPGTPACQYRKDGRGVWVRLEEGVSLVTPSV